MLTAPSLGTPHLAAATGVGLIFLMLMVSLLMLDFIIERHTLTFGGHSKIVFVAIALLLYGASFYYYLVRMNGHRLVKEFGKQVHSRSAAGIGRAIFVGTFAVPALILAYIVIFIPPIH
jgi:hypothetical protein